MTFALYLMGNGEVVTRTGSARFTAYATSFACLAVDAYASAAQADAFMAGSVSRTRVIPVVALSRRPTGEVVPVGGLAGVF